MDLQEIYKKESGYDVGRYNIDNINYYSEDYVEWLEKQLCIGGVIHCADELEPIIGNITKTAFTTPSDHGIVTVELRYGHYKMKDWKKGDKLQLKHCG